MPRFATVDEYVASLPDLGREYAERLRAVIMGEAPSATEVISYSIPAYRIGKRVLYFGCWKKHAGMYPIALGNAAFESEVKPFRSTKDTLRFRYDQPLPEVTVRKIVARQLAQR